MPIRSATALLFSLVWAILLLAGLDATLRRGPLLVYAAPAAAVDTVTDTVTVAWSSDHATIDESAGELVLTAVLSPASPGAVVLSFSSESLSAVAPDDYTALKRRVVVPAGQTEITVPVTLVDDALVEGNEQFSVTLSSSQPTVTLGLSETLVTIVDDDVADLPALTVHDAAADESAASLRFQVELSAQNSQTVTVDYVTQPGTAAAQRDYLPVSGTLVLPPGQTTAAIAVTLFDNSISEADKTVVVALSNPTQCTLVNDEAVGVIRNDDVILPTLDHGLYMPGLAR